ncbi:MAG: prolyl oligopeptidase family serine peptidase [Vulcanimicrobiaceae bacterium]
MIARHLHFCAAMVLALSSIAPLTSAAATPRAVSAEDLFKLTFVSNPQISPDGSRVVFVASRMNGPNNTYYTNLELVDAAGGAVKQITSGNHDSSPAWSPDSRTIVFVRSKKGAKPQIFTYRIADGRVVQLSHVKSGASGPLYSHDGKHIAFSSTTVDDPHPSYVDFAAAGFSPKKKQRRSDIRIIDTMHYEANGAGLVYDKHQHIWIMNVDGTGARALTSGHRWSENSYVWSPDDRTIAFNSLRRDPPSLGPSDIYTIPASGGAMRKLSSNEQANAVLDFDRSGNLWYFSGGVADPAEYPMLVTSAANGSGRRVVVARNTVAFGDIVLADMGEPGGMCGPFFAPNDAFAVTNVSAPGYSKLVKLDLRTGSATDVTGRSGEAAECTMDRGARYVAYTFSDFTHPREVYLLDLASGKTRRLTGLNDTYLASVELSKPQPFSVKDDAGYTVQAWFMPAVGPKAGGRRPTILDIHGGPETEFGNTFFHELQYLAGQGYNVVFSDPRGSVGFGYDFEEALAKHWGDAMFDDVQRVMDEAVKRPGVDPNRLAVSGGSYGGFATLWVIAHTPRYKTAIAERVVSNLATEQLASDLASDNVLGGRYSWGLPWQKGNQYLAQSPISYVADVTTPLLILHSDDDTRTPIDQTLQEFSALKILGRTVRFVDVPDENHDLSRTGAPIHRVERLHIMSQWLRGYLHP